MDNLKIKSSSLIFVVLLFALNVQGLVRMTQVGWRENLAALLLLTLPLLIIFYINLTRVNKNSTFLTLFLYFLLNGVLLEELVQLGNTLTSMTEVGLFANSGFLVLSFVTGIVLTFLLSLRLNFLSLFIKFLSFASLTVFLILLVSGSWRGVHPILFDTQANSVLSLFNSLSLLACVSFFNLKPVGEIKRIKVVLGSIATFYLAYFGGIHFFAKTGLAIFNDSAMIIFALSMQLILTLVALAIVVNQLGKKFSHTSYTITLAMAPLSIAVFYFYFLSSFTSLKEVQEIQFLLEFILITVLFMRTIYIGLSNYLPSYRKIFLYIISSFPIYFIVKFQFFEIKFLSNLGQELINKFTLIAIFFSILTFVYYTLETLLLWYAYGTKSYTSDLEDVEIETEHHIVVLIPCMNEELVIKDTVQSLLNTGYKNLEIYVIDDASEDNTVAELEKFQTDPRFQLLRRVKPEAQKGKGEALNWAYQKVTDKYLKNRGIFENTLITIIDADSSVQPDYFEKVNRVFNSDFELTGLQSKVQIINKDDNTAQDLEFEEIINATQSLRTKTNTVAFGGNGQFCKLSTLYSLHELPWTDSLVEDFDLSLRIFLSEIYNVRNVQYDDIMITQTGIYGDHQALVKQRVRWAQGNIQTFKYLYRIIKSDNLLLKQKLELSFTLLKPWLMSIEYLVVVYTIIVMAGTIIISGFTTSIQIFIFMFLLMVLYIFVINLVWATLYNRNQKRNSEAAFTGKKVIKDTYYLTKFLILLTQIYPQATIRYFTAQNGWDKTKRQASIKDNELK
jgi:glycosyltransferase involved in cell wall biosynthesis